MIAKSFFTPIQEHRMRRLAFLSGILTLSASAVSAQEFCVAQKGDVPPCMVGTWTGTNDMAERLDQVFAGLPEDLAAAARPTSGKYLFMHVAANGRFVTSPMEAAVDVNFINKDGSVAWLEQELSAAGVIGQYTAGPGDALSFCQESPGPDQLTLKGESDEGSFEKSMPLPAAGAQNVAMRHDCQGDTLTIYVDLPPPIGTVTYDLVRIPASALPGDLDYLISGE